MNNIRLVKYFILLPIFFLTGCYLGDKVIWPTLVKGTSDTFAIEAVQKNDKIKSVILLEYPDGNIAWKIVATYPMPVDEFSVQIGVVPDGFKQLVPEPQECFIPKVASEYSIVIITDNINERFHYAATFWTVEGIIKGPY